MDLINWIAEYKPKIWEEILIDYARYKGTKFKRLKMVKCMFWKEGKCDSDYNKGYKCDGIHPPCDCPYSHDKKFIENLNN